ncbi:hypothetical protein [Jiangella asiatica]|uniref:Uncharacterized protein n=1 Tax=Jiangella asiatica TaxID=2530372 RepID=A0A4R5DAL0_9ACTN|nr:hypothetical protein [Jiangella asiatica]TDE10629.1 hypothetical protein E1269_11155 [Jiangella asiatica]
MAVATASKTTRFRWRRAVRVCALAALGVVLSAAAPAAAGDVPHAGTVDELVEQLRADPVLVQPSMAMGDSRRAHEVLADAAAEVDVPVYVVLADTPSDLAHAERVAEQAAILFRAELGDGLYHVEFLDGISYTQAWGDGLDDFTVRPAADAIRRAEANAPGEYPRASALLEAVYTVRSAAEPGAALPDAVVDEYAGQPWAILPESDHDRADATAARWVAAIATGTGIVVAGLIVSLVVARTKPLPRRHHDTGPDRAGHAPAPADVRAQAERRLDAARRGLARLPAGSLSTPPATAAGLAIEAADRVLTSGDDLDAVGALVLAHSANRELDRMSKPMLEAYRPCFVNPMHGEAQDTVQVGGSSIDAPVCRSCARDRAGRPFLSVRRRLRGWVPYVETSTVWARTGFGALVGDLAAQVLDDRSARR